MQTLALVPSIGNYRFSTILDGLPFVFDVRWNTRNESWYLTVLRDDGTVIRHNIRVVLGIALGARVADADFPPGVFFAIDLTKSSVEATYDELAERVPVVYLEESDIAYILEAA